MALPGTAVLSKSFSEKASLTNTSFDGEITSDDPIIDAKQTAMDLDSSANTDSKSPYLPPCRVCSMAASGFHYGVNTCEACKGFFRRALQRKAPYVCAKANACDISKGSRNVCPACRYAKCISVGMSKTAIKTGRYTHQKRTNDTVEIQRIMASSNSPIHSSTNSQASPSTSQASPMPSPASSDYSKISLLVDKLADAFEDCFPDLATFFNRPQHIQQLVEGILPKDGSRVNTLCTNRPNEPTMQLIKNEVEAFTSLKCNLLGCDNMILQDCPILQTEDGTPTELRNNSCKPDGGPAQYYPEKLIAVWTLKMEEGIRGLVKFAKRIPEFSTLSMSDQINLIKAGRGEAAILLKYKFMNLDHQVLVDFNRSTDMVCIIPICLIARMFVTSGCVFKSHQILCQKFSSLDLQLPEAALLLALLLVSPDRESLEDPDRVESIQDQLLPVLEHVLTEHHGKHALARVLLTIPLLRTHSDLQRKHLDEVQTRYQIEFPPLLKEVLLK